MREINVSEIIKTVKKLCVDTNIILPKDVREALKKAYNNEESIFGKEVLNQIIENACIAEKEKIPMCQDTGLTAVFLEIGQDVHIVGGNIIHSINQGVREGYTESYLRKSIVSDPIERKNTGDNTPSMIHTEIVPGDKIKITIMPKGGGSENMSAVTMLPPSAGIKGIKKFVIDTVKRAGSNPCPPIIAGIGIGGSFDMVTYLAKKALLRDLNSHHPSKIYADLEKELLGKINNLGIGPQGLGGRITCMAVLIENYPCHIASIPVAVNIQCHVCRRQSVIL
jgi:fumarate hydratase subunit alpha